MKIQEKKKHMASKMTVEGDEKGQHFGPQDKFSGKQVKKEKTARKEKHGKEPAHSWDI